MTKTQEKNIAWFLPRPKKDKYKGGMPLYAEEWLLKLGRQLLLHITIKSRNGGNFMYHLLTGNTIKDHPDIMKFREPFNAKGIVVKPFIYRQIHSFGEFQKAQVGDEIHVTWETGKHQIEQ